MPENSKKLKIIIPVAVMAVILSAAAFWFKQPFWQLLPLLVSLVVMTLRADMNRFSFLLGAINCFLYSAVFIYSGLYGSIASAVLVEAPLQMATYIRWNKNAFGKATVLKKMNAKNRCVLIASAVIGCILLLFVLRKLGSSYTLINTLSTTVGIIATVLPLFKFIEYTYFSLLGGLLNILLYVRVTADMPEQITYLVFYVYSMVCVILQFINAKKLYRLQQQTVNTTEE